jgi:hypothetical protein
MIKRFYAVMTILLSLLAFSSANPYSFNLYTFDEVGNGTSGGGNVTNFTQLLDTPSTYSGSTGDCVAVNSGETGLEFVTCGNGSGGGGLTNTNGNYLYDNTTTIFFNDTFNNQTIISIGNSLYYPLTGNPSNFINSTQVTNISINNGLSTGIVEGGILGITPGNNTLFNISDGFGYIINNTDSNNPNYYRVEWTGLNNITPTYLNTNLISFIGIAPNGTIIQQSTRWTNQEARNCILIGVLVHVNLQNLDTVNQEQNIAPNPGSQIRDVLEGLGFVNVNGNLFSPNGNNLNLDKSVGVMMGSGINYYINKLNPHHLTLPSLSNLSFQYRYQNGSNDINGPEPLGLYKDVDPNNYDLNSVLTSVPNNKFTIQRIYSFTSNNVKLQRGQNIYSSLDDAKAGIGTDVFVTEPSIVANGMLRGFLILKEGTTNLNNSAEAIFIKSGKLGEESPSSGGITSSGSSPLKADGIYLYNDTTTIYFNSTLAETNLSVNKSDFWDDFDTANTTHFEQTNGKLTIIYSWLTSFIDSWFSTKTTDNLNEGSTNLYDNSSWNESHADTLYYSISNPQNFINETPNIFDQVLNSTSNVTFSSVNVTGTLDVTGDTTLSGEIYGTQQILSWGRNVNFALPNGTAEFLRTINGVPDSASEGRRALCDGSIVKIGFRADGTGLSGTGHNICGEVRVNNALVMNTCDSTGATYANTRIQARDVDLFVENDKITTVLYNRGTQTSSGNFDDVKLDVGIVCDN